MSDPRHGGTETEAGGGRAGPSIGALLGALAGTAGVVAWLWVLSGGELRRLHAWSVLFGLIGGWCVRGIVLAIVQRNPQAMATWTRNRDLLGVNKWVHQRSWFPSALAFVTGLGGIVAATWLDLGHLSGPIATASPTAIALAGGILVAACYLERAKVVIRGRVGVVGVGLAVLAACSWAIAWVLVTQGAVPADLGLSTMGAWVFTLLGGVASLAWYLAGTRPPRAD